MESLNLYYKMLLDPKTKSEIFIKLFKNVKNTKDLKEKLVKQELKCSLIKSSLILDPFQIIVAANKAITSEKLTTKSVYTEILFNLSITKNISKSLATFGAQENDDNFIVAYFDNIEEPILEKEINGEAIPLSLLKDYSDISAIKKYYKINDTEAQVIPMLDSIVSRIVTKDFLSH